MPSSYYIEFHDLKKKIFKEGVLSAFLPPVGRRSFRSRKKDVNYFIHSNYALK